jgi:hypothetical protein
LMVEDSIWLWDHLPLLRYVEQPWRLLGPAAVCLSMLAAASGAGIATLPQRWRGAALAGVLALLIVPNVAHLAPGRTADMDLASWTPRRLSERGFETTTMGEITPRWMMMVPPFNPTEANVAQGDARVREVARTAFSWSGEVNGKTASQLRLSTAYYPGWTARLDGRPVEIAPSIGLGLIELAVPPGDHQVTVSWGRTGVRRLSELITLLALAALAVLARRAGRAQSTAAPTAADRGLSLPA